MSVARQKTKDWERGTAWLCLCTEKSCICLSALDVSIFPFLHEVWGGFDRGPGKWSACCDICDIVLCDINVTGNNSFVSLSGAAKVWAKTVLDHCGKFNPEGANRRVEGKYEIRVITEKLSSIHSEMEKK